MSSPELEKELSELKTELFKLRFSLATNGLENPMKIKEVKKDIARINTILRQRELEEKKEQYKEPIRRLQALIVKITFGVIEFRKQIAIFRHCHRHNVILRQAWH